MTSPLTTMKLTDALDAFWNAALQDAQGKGFEPMAVASLMASGFAAVAQALRDAPVQPCRPTLPLGMPGFDDTPYASWYSNGKKRGWIDDQT